MVSRLSYAKSIVVGRLTADPELKQTNNGKDVLNFSLAVNRRFSKDDEVDYFDFTAWGKTAELIAAYKSKGEQLMVESDMQVDKFQVDGQNRQKVKNVAQSVVFLGSKGDTGGGDGSNANPHVDDTMDDIPF